MNRLKQLLDNQNCLPLRGLLNEQTTKEGSKADIATSEDERNQTKLKKRQQRNSERQGARKRLHIVANTSHVSSLGGLGLVCSLQALDPVIPLLASAQPDPSLASVVLSPSAVVVGNLMAACLSVYLAAWVD